MLVTLLCCSFFPFSLVVSLSLSKLTSLSLFQNSGRDGKWDLAVFAERAKEKDKEASDRAKENEAAMMKGEHTDLLLYKKKEGRNDVELILPSPPSTRRQEARPLQRRTSQGYQTAGTTYSSFGTRQQPRKDHDRKQSRRERCRSTGILRQCKSSTLAFPSQSAKRLNAD